MVIRVKELIWDEYNSDHISKHSVSIGEVEQVCKGIITARFGHSRRYLIIGQTKEKRILTIFLARKAKGVFYPVSARDSSRKERRWIQIQNEKK